MEDLQQDSVELCLTYCGYEECDPGYRFGPNQRKSYVLHFVKSGKGILEIGKKKYNISDNQNLDGINIEEINERIINVRKKCNIENA